MNYQEPSPDRLASGDGEEVGISSSRKSLGTDSGRGPSRGGGREGMLRPPERVLNPSENPIYKEYTLEKR